MSPGGAGIPQGSTPGAVPELDSCATIPRSSQRSDLRGKAAILVVLNPGLRCGDVSRHIPHSSGEIREFQAPEGSARGRLFPLPRCLLGDGFAGFREAEPNLTPLSPPRSPPRWKQLQHPKKTTGERRERSPNPPDSPGDPKNFRNGPEGAAAGAALSWFGCCRRELGAVIYCGLAGKERSQFPGVLPGASWSRTIKIPLG